MGSLAVVAFISPLHEGRVSLPKVDAVVKDLEDVGRLNLGKVDVLVALIMSGGVSRLVAGLAQQHNVARVILASHPGNNSLASALDAKALLGDLGVSVGLIHVDDEPSLVKAIEAGRAASRILGSRVALLGVGDKGALGRRFEEAFRAHVDAIPMDAFEEAVEEAPIAEAEDFVRHIAARVRFRGVDLGKLIEVGKIYAAMRRLYRQYDAAAINCFPYLIKHRVTPCLALARLNEEGLIAACEADLRAVPLMLISRELTGYSGWIANVNHLSGNMLTISHCTIALNMVDEPTALTHFESGYEYGLTGRIKFREVTLASMSSDFKRAAVTRGVVAESGLLSSNVCRTQARILVNFDIRSLAAKAPYNHHVMIPGNEADRVRAILNALGIEVVEY